MRLGAMKYGWGITGCASLNNDFDNIDIVNAVTYQKDFAPVIKNDAIEEVNGTDEVIDEKRG